MDTRGKQYGRGSRANGLLLKKGGNGMPYICFNFLDNAHLLWGSSDEDFIFYSKMDSYLVDSKIKALQNEIKELTTKRLKDVINKDNATTSDILELMDIVRSKVMEFSGIELEAEIKII